MARLPLVDRDELPADLAQLLEGRPPLNLYRVLPWSVPTARGFLTLGRAILNQSSLPRVGALTGARYEVHQHRRVAASVGLGPDKIAAALQERDEQCLDVFQRDLLRFVDAVVWQVKAPRHLYDAVAPKLGASGICELLHTIGFYMHVARFLENLDVEIEPTDVLEGALQ